jgi:hypothetical protein
MVRVRVLFLPHSASRIKQLRVSNLRKTYSDNQPAGFASNLVQILILPAGSLKGSFLDEKVFLSAFFGGFWSFHRQDKSGKHRIA